MRHLTFSTSLNYLTALTCFQNLKPDSYITPRSKVMEPGGLNRMTSALFYDHLQEVLCHQTLDFLKAVHEVV